MAARATVKGNPKEYHARAADLAPEGVLSPLLCGGFLRRNPPIDPLL
jgi:hypothetical protein